MICILALVVFAILAIFSASYKPLAAEAFDCVFRRVTFRKCRSNLDKRLKGQITGKIMKHHKKAGRFVYKYFEVFSWLFLLLLVLSTVQAGISTYNYVVYGNCNGPDETGFCIFDPLGSHQEEVSVCTDENVPQNKELLTAPSLDSISNNPKTGSADAQVTIIEFGCFSCPNTAEQAPAVKKMIEQYGSQIQFIYVDFPLPSHEGSYDAAIAAECMYEQDKMVYWHYHFSLFEDYHPVKKDLLACAQDFAVDIDKFTSCMNSSSTKENVDADIAIGKEIGIYGTPTFFINGEPLVGVKSFKLLKTKIDAALEANN